MLTRPPFHICDDLVDGTFAYNDFAMVCIAPCFRHPFPQPFEEATSILGCYYHAMTKRKASEAGLPWESVFGQIFRMDVHVPPDRVTRHQPMRMQHA